MLEGDYYSGGMGVLKPDRGDDGAPVYWMSCIVAAGREFRHGLGRVLDSPSIWAYCDGKGTPRGILPARTWCEHACEAGRFHARTPWSSHGDGWKKVSARINRVVNDGRFCRT